jgi:hypothetical protein
MLVLGEAHFETTSGRAPAPTWLTIPQRGLYTGVMIVGAVGTGKTSAVHVSLHRTTPSLASWRSGSKDRWTRPRSEGRLLPTSARDAPSRRARVGLQQRFGSGGDICYNPLHNDLDPYAVAFAIATLVNNLFGKVQRALLATGLHRSAQVRHPVAASR